AHASPNAGGNINCGIRDESGQSQFSQEPCMKKVTVVDIQRMKQEKQKIVTMTAYDFQMARIIDKAGVDIILIGDSGGGHFLGYEDKKSVKMDEMGVMGRCGSRGGKGGLGGGGRAVWS